MPARYLPFDEVLRRVFGNDSDGDYSQESEQELSEKEGDDIGSDGLKFLNKLLMHS